MNYCKAEGGENMALIECPNCRRQISDKAEKCPGCGYELPEIQEVETESIEDVKEIVCEECGTIIPEGATICPNCGCPISEDEVDGSVAEDDIENNIPTTKAQKIKLWLGDKKHVAALAAFILLIVVIAVVAINANIKASYTKSLKSTVDLMYTGASTAESCGTMIHDVWYNAIFEEYDDDTDEFTRPNGYFVDFNDALSNLKEDSYFSLSINLIETNQTNVQNAMKKLKNPPEKYKEEYDAISDLYDSYIDITKLATDPTGNLQSYTSDFNDADSEFAKKYKNMEIYL